MPLESSTLRVGDKAPAFQLAAANQAERVALKALLKSGPLIVEFLRGTW